MKSFEETTKQVAALMAGSGGNMDAYEGSPSEVSVPMSSFEAVSASIEAALQPNQKVGSYEHIKQITEETTDKTQADLLREMSELSKQLEGLTEDPFVIIDETDDSTPTKEEEEIIKRMTAHLVDGRDCEDMQADGKFWGDIEADT